MFLFLTGKGKMPLCLQHAIKVYKGNRESVAHVTETDNGRVKKRAGRVNGLRAGRPTNRGSWQRKDVPLLQNGHPPMQ